MLNSLQGATRRGIVYTLFYAWGRKALGVKESRMIMTLFHVTWEMLQEIIGPFDPFEFLFAFLAKVIKLVSVTLNLNMERTKPKPELK